jgi:hypothetical protein
MSGSAGASAPGGIGTGGTAPVASVSTGDPHNPVYNTQKLVQSVDVLCMASDG